VALPVDTTLAVSLSERDDEPGVTG
jgi:hypothetical protein